MAKPSRSGKKNSPSVPRKSAKPAKAKPTGKTASKPAAKAAKPAAKSAAKSVAKSAAKPKASAAAKATKPKAAAKPAKPGAAPGKARSSNASTAGLSPADAELIADFLPHLRAICLALPEATEVEAWGHPTFRVNDKMFASYGVEGAKASMGVKTTPDMQSALVSSDPRFSVAAYVGQHGWVSLNLAGAVDLGEVEMLVHGSYRLVAPKRLVRLLDGDTKN
jgi:predicted DNA-binding protein (MmcQ/YjbR family)